MLGREDDARTNCAVLCFRADVGFRSQRSYATREKSQAGEVTVCVAGRQEDQDGDEV
jgi:hypothetical protein